jgi:hypothetical protein
MPSLQHKYLVPDRQEGSGGRGVFIYTYGGNPLSMYVSLKNDFRNICQ